MSIDLHIHSVFSDGTHTPSELVLLAKKRGLSVVSITDHDTLSAIPELISAARLLNIKAISGVELSVKHGQQNIHILGYLFDHENKELVEKISVIQRAREQRNREIINKLISLNISIDLQEVERISKIGQTGRPHIGQALVNKGIVNNLNEAFARFLGKGKPGYVPRMVYSAEEAINIIKNSGGLAVLAHPYQIDLSIPKILTVIHELVEIGLDGLEVYYPAHTAKVRKKLKKIVVKHDIIMSGGSDYHGDIRPGTGLAGGANVHVPLEVFAKMQQRWEERRNIKYDENIKNTLQ